MKSYQYDTVGDIYHELLEIKTLLRVVAGIDTIEQYRQAEDYKKELERMDDEGV